MAQDVYDKLARHLDAMPGGFPSTDTGVEMQILRRLFSQEEAELALHLTLMPKQAKVLARRADLPLTEVLERLEQMAEKGLILRAEKEGKPVMFGAAQYVIGIWEYQVNNLNPELIRDMNEYVPTLINLDTWEKAPQLRTIPVKRSLSIEREVLAYEQAEELIQGQKKILVAPCICRREHDMVGQGCDKPEEACLVFGMTVDFYKRRGIGRVIDQSEALDIIRRADEAGLVLQPSNAQKIVNICCCCGCCCQVLKTIKRHPKPAAVVSTPFVVSMDLEQCEACRTCIDRCQMDAFIVEDDVVLLEPDRCIGCGLCVTTCPTEALNLIRKPVDEQPEIPKNMMEALRNVREVRDSLGIKRD